MISESCVCVCVSGGPVSGSPGSSDRGVFSGGVRGFGP